MEQLGRPISLEQILGRGRFDLMVTGASAVSVNGVRFGKGHGYFDLEWGMFTDIGVADERSPVIAVVHDSPGCGRRNWSPVRPISWWMAIATPTRY